VNGVSRTDELRGYIIYKKERNKEEVGWTNTEQTRKRNGVIGMAKVDGGEQWGFIYF